MRRWPWGNGSREAAEPEGPGRGHPLADGGDPPFYGGWDRAPAGRLSSTGYPPAVDSGLLGYELRIVIGQPCRRDAARRVEVSRSGPGADSLEAIRLGPSAAGGGPVPLGRGPLMRANQTARGKRRFTPRFWVMIGLACASYLAALYSAGCYRIFRLHQAIARVERQVRVTEQRNQQLRIMLARMDSDVYIEQVAREKLGLVRPGETPYVIARPQDPANPFYVKRRPGEANELTNMEGW